LNAGKLITAIGGAKKAQKRLNKKLRKEAKPQHRKTRKKKGFYEEWGEGGKIEKEKRVLEKEDAKNPLASRKDL